MQILRKAWRAGEKQGEGGFAYKSCERRGGQVRSGEKAVFACKSCENRAGQVRSREKAVLHTNPAKGVAGRRIIQG